MLKILFRGNDDGFTFAGVIVFLFVLLLIVPVVNSLLSAAFQAEQNALDGRKALFEERQSELDAEKAEEGLLSGNRVEYSL